LAGASAYPILRDTFIPIGGVNQNKCTLHGGIGDTLAAAFSLSDSQPFSGHRRSQKMPKWIIDTPPNTRQYTANGINVRVLK
jgi:hypothetical protein